MKAVTSLLDHPVIVDTSDQTNRARQLRALANGVLSARDLGMQCRSEAESAAIRYTRRAEYLRSEASRHYARAIGYLTSIRGLA